MREDSVHKFSFHAAMLDAIPAMMGSILRSLCRARFVEDIDPIIGHPFIYHHSGQWSDAVMSQIYYRQGFLHSATGHVEMWAADLCHRHWPDAVHRAVMIMDAMIRDASPGQIFQTLLHPGSRLDIIVHTALARRFSHQCISAHLLQLEARSQHQFQDMYFLSAASATAPLMPTEPQCVLRLHEELTAAHCRIIQAPFVPTLHQYDNGWHDWDTGIIDEDSSLSL